MQIRLAKLTDTEALTSCIDAAYAKYVGIIPDLPAVSDGCADEIINHQVWVAVEDKEIIAGIFLVPNDGFMKLANLAVHPDHGGKGVGRALMDLCESETKRQGYVELRLNTHASMPANVALYEHLGWEVSSQSGNTVSMRKSLSTK